jgi:hypothetical protein
VNGQWGVFSQAIPGRVGYQCSNFYRQLIESGQIKDPNYIVDEKGKAHFIFKNKGAKINGVPVNGTAAPGDDVQGIIHHIACCVDLSMIGTKRA